MQLHDRLICITFHLYCATLPKFRLLNSAISPGYTKFTDALLRNDFTKKINKPNQRVHFSSNEIRKKNYIDLGEYRSEYMQFETSQYTRLKINRQSQNKWLHFGESLLRVYVNM